MRSKKAMSVAKKCLLLETKPHRNPAREMSNSSHFDLTEKWLLLETLAKKFLIVEINAYYWKGGK
jgi:hypothetical protein